MAIVAQAGDWNDVNTWVGGVVPLAGEDALVNYNVTLPTGGSIIESPVGNGCTTNINASAVHVGCCGLIVGQRD